jgi:hypothetical protein
MYLFKHKPLAILFGALLIFSACKKESDPTHEPPVTEPLTTAAVKPGDTLVIKGQNFSTTLTDNVVSFNGVAGTVVSVTATEIIVVVPAAATSGDVTVTVHGHTTKVGTLVVAPLTLYCIKNNFAGNTAVRTLVALDPATGSETVVEILNNYDNSKILDIEYLAATNEVVGVNEDGSKLLKVDLTTKQTTALALATGSNNGVSELVLDNSGNLYGIKHNWSDPNHYTQSLVKIDPKTGYSTIVKTIEYNGDWESLVYLPASNTVAGLTNVGTRLLKVSLTTKDTSSVGLPGSNLADYRELVVVNGTDLYGYKGNYSDPSNAIADLTKINVSTGEETLVSHLSTYGKIHDHLVYLSQRKEIATIWEQTGLFKFNVPTLAKSIISLTTQGITYGPITSN